MRLEISSAIAAHRTCCFHIVSAALRAMAPTGPALLVPPTLATAMAASCSAAPRTSAANFGFLAATVATSQVSFRREATRDACSRRIAPRA